MQLKVIKSDGSVEEYLHTKVIGSINNAFVLAGEPCIAIAEQLAEAVTYFLYSNDQRRQATSSEIFSMIQIVLGATSYEAAAEAMVECHHRRLLKRRRIEVIDDWDAGVSNGSDGEPQPWNKSRIVSDLMEKQKLARGIARVIASMVEQKVLNLGVSRISHGLIEQLVLADTRAVIQAEQQLQAAPVRCSYQEDFADTDVRLRQQQKGLCTVGL